MKKIILSISMLLLIFVANAQQNKAEIAEKLKAIEAGWNSSALDKDHGVAYKTKIIAEDFYQLGDNGKVENKAASINKQVVSKETITSVVNGPMTVHFYGTNVATVIGSHMEKGNDKDGKPFTRQYGWADTFMERNGNWQCIGSGSTQYKKDK